MSKNVQNYWQIVENCQAIFGEPLFGPHSKFLGAWGKVLGMLTCPKTVDLSTSCSPENILIHTKCGRFHKAKAVDMLFCQKKFVAFLMSGNKI